jgi:drug/metabolite transporter (DMT)-like permease
MTKVFGYLHRHRNPLKWLFFALLILIVVGDFFVERHEVHFAGDRIYGFWALFGLAVCIAMTYVCKGISHSGLGKVEDYYDR